MDHNHESILPDDPFLEVEVVLPGSLHESKVRATSHHLFHHARRVNDVEAECDFGGLSRQLAQPLGNEILAHRQGGGDAHSARRGVAQGLRLAPKRLHLHENSLDGSENIPGLLTHPSASGASIEEADPEARLEFLHPGADRGLGESVTPRSPAETAQLRDAREHVEGEEVRKRRG